MEPRTRRPSGTMPRGEPAATVFLADDDDDFRRALRGILEADGYDVFEVSNGADALEHLARAADALEPLPDVVILDVLMPGFSGLGILRVLRRFDPMPPTILVTGFRDSSVAALARNLGAACVLHKPIDEEDVRSAVLSAMLRSMRSRSPQPRGRVGRTKPT